MVVESEKTESSGFKKILADCKKTFKEKGIRGLIQQYSWKIVVLFVLFYLVRDTILYILIPYLIAKQFL